MNNMWYLLWYIWDALVRYMLEWGFIYVIKQIKQVGLCGFTECIYHNTQWIFIVCSWPSAFRRIDACWMLFFPRALGKNCFHECLPITLLNGFSRALINKQLFSTQKKNNYFQDFFCNLCAECFYGKALRIKCFSKTFDNYSAKSPDGALGKASITVNHHPPLICIAEDGMTLGKDLSLSSSVR